MRKVMQVPVRDTHGAHWRARVYGAAMSTLARKGVWRCDEHTPLRVHSLCQQWVAACCTGPGGAWHSWQMAVCMPYTPAQPCLGLCAAQ